MSEKGWWLYEVILMMLKLQAVRKNLLMTGFAFLEMQHAETTILDMNSNKAWKCDSTEPSEADEPEDALIHNWNKIPCFFVHNLNYLFWILLFQK